MKAIQKHTFITPAQLYCLAKNNRINSVEDTDPRITPLRRYGSNALAYSTLQPGLEYFFDQGGYVAFKRFGTVRPSIHVLGDPIAEDKKSILRKFALQYPGALFCQISEETAQFLAELGGFFINICGVERVINVQEFCLDGKKMADMRRFRNVCQKAGVHVFESSPEGYATSMQAITREWLASKPVANRELAFLARPMVYDREFDVRYLFASVENTIVAYIIYDPVYEYGSIVGYHAVTQRARTNVPKGTLDFINMHFIELLKREREREGFTWGSALLPELRRGLLGKALSQGICSKCSTNGAIRFMASRTWNSTKNGIGPRNDESIPPARAGYPFPN